MENLLKTNKHTVCCLGGKTKPTNCEIVLGWGSSDKKKRKEVFFCSVKTKNKFLIYGFR